MKNVLVIVVEAVWFILCCIFLGILIPTIVALFSYSISDLTLCDVFGNIGFIISAAIGSITSFWYVNNKIEGTWD